MTRLLWIAPGLALALICAAPAARAEDEELPPTSQFFDELDRDGDGCVSQDEFEGGSDSFRLLDKNKDGLIKPDELGLPADYKPQPKKPAARGKQGGDQARGGDRLKKALERMDANKDGKISKDEFRGPPEAFDRVDRNKDGFLDEQDLGGGKQPGAKPNRGRDRGRAQMAKRLRQLDTDGDGRVSRDEYRGPDAFFERLDANANGFIDADEIDQLDGGAKRKRKISPEAAAARFEQLDKNGDGVLTADDGVPGRYLETVDANADGRVSLEEFQAAVAKAQARDGDGEEQKPAPSKGRLTAGMLRRFDKNKDGKVTADEYPGSEERFKGLDADGDGVLTKADLP